MKQMPLVSPTQDNPFVDGRQSRRALQVRTGVERYFTERNWASLPELTLKTGRRADLVALSPKGQIAIIEIKSSIADLRSDSKWPEYREFCDQLFFATLPDVPSDVFPEDAGLMLADDYGAEILRVAQEHPLPTARRKALHLQFARASAQRLSRCCIHAGYDGAIFAD